MTETDLKTLKALKKQSMGWLSPDGQVIPCKMYEHLGVLKDSVENFDDLMATIEEIDNIEAHWNEETPDEHRGLHYYLCTII